MEPFRNIGIIGRLGSTQVLDTIRRLKKFLIDRHLHVILEDTIAEVLPGHGLQTCSRKIMGEICDLVVVVGAEHAAIAADHHHLSLIHISEPTRQAEISYAVFCLKKKKKTKNKTKK